METSIQQRLDMFRHAMRQAGIAAAIIPQTDPHLGEYLASHWQVRRYLSGFTGSAGTLVVTMGEALLWTDSRYFLQGAQQLQGSGIQLMKEGLPQTPSIASWLCANLVRGARVGLDGTLFPLAETQTLAHTLERHGLRLDTAFAPIDTIWPDRPELPDNPVFVHEVKYAGETAQSKIAKVLAGAREQGANAILVTDLAEVAWTLNLRSSDVSCNPVLTAFLFLGDKGHVLFVKESKIDPDVRHYLDALGVSVAPYANLVDYLSTLPSDVLVLVEASRTATAFIDALGGRALVGASPIPMLKAVKNSTQIEGIHRAMAADGVALVGAVREIERRLAQGDPALDEVEIAAILRRHRSAQPGFFDESFDTIAGYGPHGAIVHYSATPESSSRLQPKGLLLIDSGAQYLYGTTDITRTIALGEPTADEKRDFTLVMKGHIALAQAIFPEGTRGAQLDVLARLPLWRNGLSYLHGTGHGVGCFLNVHEGPQSIRLNNVPATLRPGMLTSNEPGLYREGVHGIRCENLVLTTEAFTSEFGHFYRFETVTLFPFDRSLFDTAIMTREETDWVNAYHAHVCATLEPLLPDEAARQWLRDKTQPLA